MKPHLKDITKIAVRCIITARKINIQFAVFKDSYMLTGLIQITNKTKRNKLIIKTYTSFKF